MNVVELEQYRKKEANRDRELRDALFFGMENSVHARERRPGRTHDGVVIALRSNIRWCSDHFELACRNGEIVRVLFAIDACDREVMAWLATSAGISGEMVRDLMVACVERRSGSARRRIPSNGCPTTARLTSPRTRSTPQRPWASSFVSRQSARRNPTASRRHSSKPSNATMLGYRSCRMLTP
jgi:hypothetical protein